MLLYPISVFCNVLLDEQLSAYIGQLLVKRRIEGKMRDENAA